MGKTRQKQELEKEVLESSHFLSCGRTVACVTETMEPPVLDDHGTFPPLGTPLGTTPETAPMSESYTRKRETQSQQETMGKTWQKQELKKEVLE
ncbi:hypothetical protein QYF36_021831 [Acer negundo]|nr:hypothetical protein QYF36_021831 [Acer negundo]